MLVSKPSFRQRTSIGHEDTKELLQASAETDRIGPLKFFYMG
jgi:hypothetical protein